MSAHAPVGNRCTKCSRRKRPSGLQLMCSLVSMPVWDILLVETAGASCTCQTVAPQAAHPAQAQPRRQAVALRRERHREEVAQHIRRYARHRLLQCRMLLISHGHALQPRQAAAMPALLPAQHRRGARAALRQYHEEHCGRRCREVRLGRWSWGRGEFAVSGVHESASGSLPGSETVSPWVRPSSGPCWSGRQDNLPQATKQHASVRSDYVEPRTAVTARFAVLCCDAGLARATERMICRTVTASRC